jgi:hypothetical protein
MVVFDDAHMTSPALRNREPVGMLVAHIPDGKPGPQR